MDIQQILDDYYESHPELHKYLDGLVYIPAGGELPEGVTHTLRLQSASSLERSLTVGGLVKPPYVQLLDMLLSITATSPIIPKP